MRIGVDIGGTKIEVVALDDTGASLARERQPTPAGDYAATLDVVTELVASVETRVGRRGTIGIGSPGSISYKTGLLQNSNSTVLNGKPLDRDLAACLGREILLENDANCFALSEATVGAGAGAPTVFGVILGTGVGGGLIMDGRIRQGCNGIAGEWGHNPLPWAHDGELPGASCYCGRSGCIETFLSGSGLVRAFLAAGGEPMTADAIGLRARDGDSAASQAIALYQDRLARALAHVINLLDPHVIVLGGGLSNLDVLYRDLGARVARYCFGDAVSTQIVRNKHGDSSGVRGAAWLWPPEERC